MLHYGIENIRKLQFSKLQNLSPKEVANLFIALILFVIYCCSYIPYINQFYFTITTARILPPNCWIWTLITFNFYNSHILNLLSSIFSIYILDISTSTTWSTKAIIMFSIIIQITSAAITILFIFIGYAITFNPDLLWSTSISGLTPLLGGALVTARMLTPDTILINSPLGNIRIKHMPFSSVCCAFLLSILGLHCFVDVILLIVGVMVSWIYLRFFQRHSNGDIGNTSDAFKFSGFFPNHLEPPLSIASNAIYNLTIQIRMCKRQSTHASSLLPTSLEPEKFVELDPLERQKQLALKSLDEQFDSTKSSQKISPLFEI